MQLYKIGYLVKSTRSNNTYVEITKDDENLFLQSILSITHYIGELSLSQDEDVKQFVKWYRTTDKRFPYSKKLDKRNTPETMLCGIINNMLFGNQKNLSLEQLPYYEEIINNCVIVIKEIQKDKKIDLQVNPCLNMIKFGISF